MAEQILIISPVQVFPAFSGNSKRILSVCTELMKEGYHLDFFYTGFDNTLHENHEEFFNGRILKHRQDEAGDGAGLRISELINGLRIRIQRAVRFITDDSLSAAYNKGLAEYYNVRQVELLRRQTESGQYSAVLVNYAVYSHYLDLFPDSCIKIVDTHDRLSDRYKLYLEKGEYPPNWHSLRPLDEQAALSKADEVWAITSMEAEHFRRLLSGRQTTVRTIRHLIPYRPVENRRREAALLFTGSHNRLNIDGIRWFLQEVWPRILNRSETIRLVIAGTICDTLRDRQIPDQVDLYGRFDDEVEVYSLTDLCINPMQAGTGLKIKTMEALAAGKVVISTTHGAEGMEEFTGSGLICSDKPGEWSDAIGSFFRDPEFRERAGKGARSKVEQVYEVNRRELLESVGKTGQSV